MTGRERLTSILQGRPVDRLAWTALVDNSTLNVLPEHLRGNGGLDFYRHLGCDIFLLNGWNTPYAFRGPVLHWPEGVEDRWRQDGDCDLHELCTPGGTLTTVYRKGHPIKFPVDSYNALRIYHELWEHARYEDIDETATFQAIETAIGDDGIMTRFWGPSTIPRLLENDMGSEQFYYLLEDHPEEMNELIALMHAREMDAFHMLARGPWDNVTLVENTSTYYIGPEIYRRYNMPHVRDFVSVIHEEGKVAIIHMCGHVHDILADIKETDLDGVHALTPPPLGDTPWETALDVLGEDQIIFSCLPANIYLQLSPEEVIATLDRMITPRIARSRFVLGLFADGIVAPYERFLLVKDWIERRHGGSHAG